MRDKALIGGIMLDGMLKRGVLVGRGGLFYNRLRYQPPLCITKEETDRAMQALDETLTEIERKHAIR